VDNKDNNKKDINYNEDLTFNSNSESGLMRCRGCGCAIFSMHKEQIINEKTNSSSYTMVAACCECLASTIVSDLRERYYNDEVDGNNSGSTIISVKFKEQQLIALDNFLDLIKKQFSSIVNNTTAEANISESEKQKYACKLVQVENLMKLIKSTAHD
jgi:hypothetical protein